MKFTTTEIRRVRLLIKRQDFRRQRGRVLQTNELPRPERRILSQLLREFHVARPVVLGVVAV